MDAGRHAEAGYANQFTSHSERKRLRWLQESDEGYSNTTTFQIQLSKTWDEINKWIFFYFRCPQEDVAVTELFTEYFISDDYQVSEMVLTRTLGNDPDKKVKDKLFFSQRCQDNVLHKTVLAIREKCRMTQRDKKIALHRREREDVR